jgi:hypothetical protein
MGTRTWTAAAVITLALGLAGPARAVAPPPGADDATVIAVIDSAMNPYHWDFLASKMPQALDADPANDLPLDRPASEWLAGAPAATRLDVKLEQFNANANPNTLQTADQAKWNTVRPSTAAQPKLYWLPGTKVIGALTFSATGKIAGPTSQHGVGTTSTAVGNLNGTCPECLLVFIQYGTAADAEAAIAWAESQPWIDAISNSYGFSLISRDRLYSRSDVAAQRTASERGQSVFFSAGNGQENAFVAPNPTIFSSQEGPDWIVTVGAVTPGPANYYGEPLFDPHAPYSGTGKPADVAGIGESYPDAYGATKVSGVGSGFGGTSNATPQIAGLYGRALGLARTALSGPSRTQAGGVIATGTPVACGAARPACELGDGVLTASELRTRLFEGAAHTGQGYSVGGVTPSAPAADETELLAVGHGFYAGREAKDREAFAGESEGLLGVMDGTAPALARPAGERDWMVVDSYCRQQDWGVWSGGYFVDGTTALPGTDPDWPLRSTLEATCPGGPTPVN